MTRNINRTIEEFQQDGEEPDLVPKKKIFTTIVGPAEDNLSNFEEPIAETATVPKRSRRQKRRERKSKRKAARDNAAVLVQKSSPKQNKNDLIF